MKSKLNELLLGAAIMSVGTSHIPEPRFRNSNILENGNDRRSHKENVRRRKLRRISKKSKQINRS